MKITKRAVLHSYMKKKLLNNKKGFTVLELLVVIGILSILVGLVFTGLNNARRRSNDERKVAALRPVVVGLREYFNICRQYPATLSGSEDCPVLSSQQKTLASIIPGVADLDFNNTGSKYHYASLVNDPNSSECTNFHTWIELDAANPSLANQKNNSSYPYMYAGQTLVDCPGSTAPGGLSAGSQNDTIFDIFK